MHVEALSPLQRVLIIAGAAVLLPVIAVLALLLRNEFADRQAAVEQSALENAHVLIELADALLRGDLQTMRVLATSVPLVTGDLATARDRGGRGPAVEAAFENADIRGSHDAQGPPHPGG